MLPENGTYMIAGYIAVGVIYGMYAISLFLRAREERRKYGGANLKVGPER